MPYPKNKITYRHYGKNVEMMLASAIKITDEEKKEKYIQAIASYMKLAHMTWSKGTVTDEEIMNDLEHLAEGKVKMNRENKITTLVQIRNTPPKKTFKKSNSKRRNYR